MKKVLGVLPSSDTITFGIVSGDKDCQAYIPLEKPVVKKLLDDTESLLAVRDITTSLIREHGINQVVILKAGTHPKSKTSRSRIKFEASVQISSSEAKVPVSLVAPKTFDAAQTRAQKRGDVSIEEKLKQTFASKDKRTAAQIALYSLIEEK